MYLIDFGTVHSYLSKDGKHLKLKVKSDEEFLFMGNLMYASKNAFTNMPLSRRDDMISLVYIMISLVSQDIPWAPPP